MPVEKIFKSYDIRGRVGTQLNPNNVNNIARAYADWLPTQGIVAVGHDMRPDSAELAEAFIAGVLEQGYDVWDIGLVTTDMVYFAVGKWDLAGGAVITASHNPGQDNGIKLYRDKVTAVGLDSGLADIRDAFIENRFQIKASPPGRRVKKTITNEWLMHCLTFIDKLASFNIAIDAGNGMAGAILPKLLSQLPLHAETMYFELDGTFPNHDANPQVYENLADLINQIKTKWLDFGIAFDGDGDRAAFVDDLGRPVLGSDLISLVAKLYIAKYPGSKIVVDVRTSRATRELIKEWGGQPVVTKAGRVNIGSKMREIGSPFGSETTGHMFFKENYDADSGLIAALVAMQAITNSNRKLSELVDEYRRYAMIPEKNIEATLDQSVIFNKLRQAFKDGDQEELDGLTVNYRNRWFNLRASNTEPVMRLNAEATTEAALKQLVTKVTDIITS